MKKFISELKSIFVSTKGSLSSKRICGVFGWLVCLIVTIYCTYKGTQAPLIADSIILATVALLGVDSITGIWKKPNDSDKDR